MNQRQVTNLQWEATELPLIANLVISLQDFFVPFMYGSKILLFEILKHLPQNISPNPLI